MNKKINKEMSLCQSIILIGRNGSDNTVTSDARSTISYQNLTKWPPNNPFLILDVCIKYPDIKQPEAKREGF